MQGLAASLRADIGIGEFAPGQRLIETELTERYAVSRGPLREALRILSVEGVVDIEPNRGATVRRMTLKEVSDTMSVRIVLETLAAELAAANIDVGRNRARFEKLAKRISEPVEKSQARFLEENRQLHDMLTAYSNNQALMTLITQLQLPQFPHRNTYAADDEAYRKASNREHVAIVEAVLSGNRARAKRAMTQHLMHSRKRLTTMLQRK